MRAAAILGLLVPIVACTPSAEAVRDDPVVHAPGSGLASPTTSDIDLDQFQIVRRSLFERDGCAWRRLSR